MRVVSQAIHRAWPLAVLITATSAWSAEVPAEAPADPPEEVPDCSVAVNGSGETEIEPGLPLVVIAYWFVPGGGDSTAPTLEVRSGDAVQAWPLKPASSDQPATGDERRKVWVLEPDATRTLAAGEYRVAFALKEKDKSLAECAPAVVRIAAAGKSKIGDAARFRTKLRYELASGRAAEAEKVAAAWLEKQPESIEALLAAGDVAAGSGDLDRALQLYQQAMERWLRTTESAVEPPVAILSRQSAALRAKENKP